MQYDFEKMRATAKAWAQKRYYEGSMCHHPTARYA